MSLRKLPHKRLRHLVGIHLSTKEYSDTRTVISELSIAKKRGHLTKRELLKVCRWKSPRVIGHIKRNREDAVKRVTRAVFSTRSEQEKMRLLTSLHGVSIPMASSILMLTNPKRYGVIDIRVWQLLHKMGAVDSNPEGVAFGFKYWYRFVELMRFFAKLYNVNARDIERTLFNVHVQYQKGTLYKRKR